MSIDVYCDNCGCTYDAPIESTRASALVPVDVFIDGVSYFLCPECKPSGVIRTINGPILYGLAAQNFVDRERVVNKRHEERIMALREKYNMTSSPNSLEEDNKQEHSLSVAEFRALEKALNELAETIQRLDRIDEVVSDLANKVSSLQASDTAHHQVFGGPNSLYLGPLDFPKFEAIQTSVETEADISLDVYPIPQPSNLQEICPHTETEEVGPVIDKVDRHFVLQDGFVRCKLCGKYITKENNENKERNN